MKNSDILKLMGIIGLPAINIKPSQNLSQESLLSLLPLAVKNKVPLLFLEHAADMCNDSKSLSAACQVYRKKSQLALSLIRELSEILNKKEIDHVIFKTLKPFPFTTVDVDVLFFNRENFKRAYNELRDCGFKLAGCGAFSISLYSPKHVMNIDLQVEISVSRLVYIHKQLLQEHVTERYVKGCKVRVFEPDAALIAVLAHSFYKEQILPLSDYYTTVIELLAMTKHQRRSLADLAEKAHVGLGVKATLMLINTLTAMAFSRILPPVTETAKMIKTSAIEEKNMLLALNHFAKNPVLPYKHAPLTLAAALTIKIIRDPVMRGALAQQFAEMATDMPKFLESALLHIRRDAY